jgi:uncharacterized membrane protein
MTPSGVETVARGEGSRIVEARRMVVRTEAEWRALWAAHGGPTLPAPQVDFATRMVAAVFAGERPTPGYDVEIADIRREGPALALVVESHRPDPGMIAPQIIMTPFHIVSLPRYDGHVIFVEGGAGAAKARRAAPTSVPPEVVTSSTGLEPTIAAALAYLVGPVSGVLILLAERSSRYVRFHAWQSIIGLGGLWAIGFVLYLFAFVALLVSPTAFRVMLWLAGLTWLAWVIVWIVCLVKAFSGEMWKLPIAGSQAEQRAGPQ